MKDGGHQGKSSTLNVPYEEIIFKQALDRGAFGEVYCGQWRGNEVAIKVGTAMLCRSLHNEFCTAGFFFRADDAAIPASIQERGVCDELFAPPKCCSDDGGVPEPP